MNKIGFKFNWEQDKPKRTRKPKVEEEMPMIIPGTGMAHILEVSMKIEEMETFMTTASFTRMTKTSKAAYINAYRFMVTTLALVNVPQGGGMSEYTNMDSIGFVNE